MSDYVPPLRPEYALAESINEDVVKAFNKHVVPLVGAVGATTTDPLSLFLTPKQLLIEAKDAEEAAMAEHGVITRTGLVDEDPQLRTEDLARQSRYVANSRDSWAAAQGALELTARQLSDASQGKLLGVEGGAAGMKTQLIQSLESKRDAMGTQFAQDGPMWMTQVIDAVKQLEAPGRFTSARRYVNKVLLPVLREGSEVASNSADRMQAGVNRYGQRIQDMPDGRPVFEKMRAAFALQRAYEAAAGAVQGIWADRLDELARNPKKTLEEQMLRVLSPATMRSEELTDYIEQIATAARSDMNVSPGRHRAADTDFGTSGF